MKNMRLKDSLSGKLGVRIAGIATACLVVLITISIIQIVGALKESMDGEFANLAEANASVAKAKFDASIFIAEDFASYMEGVYTQMDKGTINKDYTYESELYSNRLLGLDHYIAENYLISTSISAIQNDNTDIAEVGIFFEPYAFDSSIETYGFHITEETAVSGNYTVVQSNSGYLDTELYLAGKNANGVAFGDSAEQADGRYFTYVYWAIRTNYHGTCIWI